VSEDKNPSPQTQLTADFGPFFAKSREVLTAIGNSMTSGLAPQDHAQPVSDAMVDAWRIAFHKSYDGGKGAADYNSHIRKGLEAALAIPSPQSRGVGE